jgi:allantoinase
MRTQVTKKTLQFKNKLTPYEGMVLSRKVEQTILRGIPTDRAGGPTSWRQHQEGQVRT